MEVPTTTTSSQQQQEQISDNDRGNGQLHALDCNLTSLCDHVQIEGFNSGSFSDIDVHAMGSTYHLHRLILSRSSYFRNMLVGPWKEAKAAAVTLHIDDKNVNGEAVAMALAYLYGYHPKLNDDNAFRVLAAASFLDLQDLCAICTEFIVSELWTANFLAYQVFAESQDYGVHGERVRRACWGYLCQCGALELKEILPRLSSQTLLALLTSNNFWVPSEEARFQLALYALLSKGAMYNAEHLDKGSAASDSRECTESDLCSSKRKGVNTDLGRSLESSLRDMSLCDKLERQNAPQNMMNSLVDHPQSLQSGVSNIRQQIPQAAGTRTTYDMSVSQPCYSYSSDTNESQTSCGYVIASDGPQTIASDSNLVHMEGPSDDRSYVLDGDSWLVRDQAGQCPSACNTCNERIPNWDNFDSPYLSWGCRLVRKGKMIDLDTKDNCVVRVEGDDTFQKIFEGGSLFYCNMSFEALLNVRKQLEELGFPCKALNDGLWLQMLLNQKVHEIGADTCKNCCLVSSQCACRQTIRYPHGNPNGGYYMQDNDMSTASDSIGNVYITESGQGEGHRLFRPVRVHVRGPNDGLAGLGRGATFVPDNAWPPTRFVFSRVPMGNRNFQNSVGNDDGEPRAELSADVTGDGLTALVGLSQGASSSASVGAEQPTLQCSTPGSFSCSSPVQMVQSAEDSLEFECENTSTPFSWDMKKPLSHFPPFRFGVEFVDVHRLSVGQVKHSPEVFYAGSLWKVSVQAFNDEDLQGRRTLGLFLHRRKADMIDLSRKAHVYVDSREKVTARYQLICPSKREVMEFGHFKQPGTLLPKAPKGWGWRTALLFDELGDLLQNGALRVVAVVQLV